MTSIEVEQAITNISSKEITVNAVNVPIIPLVSEDGTDVNAYVLMNESTEILKWFPQAIPGDEISEAMIAYKDGGFTAGSDIAFTLDLWGSGRYGDSEDLLLDKNSKNSENLTFTWEETIVTFTGEENENLDPMMALILYTGLMEKNWSK